jgi:hypothetical protein
MSERLIPRKSVHGAELLGASIERDPENFATRIAGRLADEVFEIPSGAFSGIATYTEDGEEKRISKELDEAIAQHFTNQRYIVKEINDIGPITSTDPRVRFALQKRFIQTVDDIDQLILQTAEYLDSFNQVVETQTLKLKERLAKGELSARGYKRAQEVFANSAQLYNILIQELQLKKRGFEFSLEEWNQGSVPKAHESDEPLEIRNLPGGNFLIMRGYRHMTKWQKNFGDSREHQLGVADIYSGMKYVAVEGHFGKHLGESIPLYWGEDGKGDYDRLVKELVKNGFEGVFVEFDSRFDGKEGWDTLDEYNLTDKQAKILFGYITKFNPDLAKKIGTEERFVEFFHKQRTELGEFRESLSEREVDAGLKSIIDGTNHHASASVNRERNTSAVPTGFELGQMAFSDALSVIKMLIMNKAMNDGRIERGTTVDFQGSSHLSYKSYFFDNPQYAMEVVLTNIHEALASIPGVENLDDMLKKLQYMDVATWREVLTFIGTFPFARVSNPGWIRNSVEVGWHQRPIRKQQSFSAVAHLANGQKKALKVALQELAKHSRTRVTLKTLAAELVRSVLSRSPKRTEAH